MTRRTIVVTRRTIVVTGQNNVVMEQNNVVTGQNNVVTEQNNVVTGQNNVVTGQNNVVMEQNNVVMGQNNVVMGQNNVVMERNNVVMGHHNRASRPRAIARKSAIAQDLRETFAKTRFFAKVVFPDRRCIWWAGATCTGQHNNGPSVPPDVRGARAGRQRIGSFDMGTNLPSQRGPAITWITEHLAQWTANAAAIGVDPAAVTAAAALTNTATNAKTAAGTARQASKDATLDWYEKADLAIEAARDLILEIKSFAASSDDPQVYVLAGLSPRDEPGETPAPESPSAITATLLPGGPIRLGWTCRGPQGTFYIVNRQLDGESGFTMIATVTDKTFTDNNLPKGIDQVLYQINAQKNEKVTLGDIKLVQLGSGGNQQQGEQAA